MRTNVIVKNRKSPRRKERVVTEYSAGGIMASTGAGAATGAMVGGPWGAAIGGVIGAGVGVYQHTQERKAEKEQDKILAEARNQEALNKSSEIARRDSSILEDYNNNANTSLYYPFGGVAGIGRGQQRGLKQINSTDRIAVGPNHAQGGVPIGNGNEVEGNENVRVNPQTGETEIDSKRLGTAQANQPLMEMKAQIEQQLQALKSLKAKAFLAKTKVGNYRTSNAIERKMDIVDPQIMQLEEQLMQVQQAIESNFAQQQAINGDSQGQQQPMGATGIQAAYGARLYPYGGGINPDGTVNRRMPIGWNPQLNTYGGEDGYLNYYGANKTNEITTGAGFNTYEEATRPIDRSYLGSSMGKPFGTARDFGQGQGVMGNATLGVNQNIGTAKVLPITTSDGKLANATENIVLPKTESPVAEAKTGGKKNQAIGGTGYSAMAQGVAAVGTYMANKHYIDRLKKMPLDTLDRQQPLLYTTNIDNTNRTLIERQITELRRAYQENPTPANEARLMQAQNQANTALAQNESQRREAANNINNANRQTVNSIGNANTGIDKYNNMLKYNKAMGIANAEAANTQGLINGGATAANTAIGGINTNRRLREESKINPDSVLSKSFVASDYSWGNNNAIAADLQLIADATPGTARDKKYEELKEISGKTDDEMQAILKKYNIQYSKAI